MKKTYKQITFCENKKRIYFLENFKLHLKNYLDNLQFETSYGPSENKTAEEEHKEISKLKDEACSYIEATSKDKNICLKRDINIYDKNILHRKYICDSLTKMTKEAISIYKRDSRRAKWRIEPFLWIFLQIEYLFVNLFLPFLKIIFQNKVVKAIFMILITGFVIYLLSKNDGLFSSFEKYLIKIINYFI